MRRTGRLAAADRVAAVGGDAARGRLGRARARHGASPARSARAPAARRARHRGVGRAGRPPAAASLALAFFGVAAALTTPGRPPRGRGLAFAARRRRPSRSAPREPRTGGHRARLRDADEAADHVAAPRDRRCGMFVGAGGVPPRGRSRDDARPRARVRRRQRAQPLLDRDIDPLMGSGRVAAGRGGPDRAGARARVRARAVGVLVRPARGARERRRRAPRARGRPVLRARLHALAEAVDAAEHRDRRRRRRGTAARRLGRGATGHLGSAALVMFVVVFFWTPPHFWALALMIKEHYANARVPMLPVVRGERGDGPRRSSGTRSSWSRSTLLPVALGTLRARLRRRGARARRRLLVLRARAGAGRCSRPAAVRLFHYSLALPRAAVRRDGGRPGAGVTENLAELSRAAAARDDARGDRARCASSRARTTLWGWALFGVFLLLFAGTVGVAFVYLALD